MRVPSAEKRQAILHLPIEGNSIRSTERLAGVHRDTNIRYLVFAGNYAGIGSTTGCGASNSVTSKLMKSGDSWRRKGRLGPARMTSAGAANTSSSRSTRDTGLIPAFTIGKRTAANAEHSMLDLAERIRAPRPGEPRIRLRISSDGFAACPGAVDLAFASTVDRGMVVKDFREGMEQPGRDGPPEMTATARRAVTGDSDPMTISTNYSERNNLSIGTFIRRFTRLSLGLGKELEDLVAAVCLHMAHDNFCRRHGTLRMTPAMAAGVTGELWKLDRLIKEIGRCEGRARYDGTRLGDHRRGESRFVDEAPMRLPRPTTRRLMAAVAAVGCAIAAVGFWEERASRLTSARQYRWYEGLARSFGRCYEPCASRHANAGRTSESCRSCGICWGHLRTFDGRQVGSAAEAVAVHRQAAALFARRARRYERGALTPWLRLSPISPADRDAWKSLHKEDGPLGRKFFTVL